MRYSNNYSLRFIVVKSFYHFDTFRTSKIIYFIVKVNTFLLAYFTPSLLYYLFIFLPFSYLTLFFLYLTHATQFFLNCVLKRNAFTIMERKRVQNYNTITCLNNNNILLPSQLCWYGVLQNFWAWRLINCVEK